MQKKFLIPIFFLIFGFLFFAAEASAQEETQTFFIDNSYDLYGRRTIEAELVREDSNLYFYAEKSWWDSYSATEQNDLRIALAALGLEFQKKIYPALTSTFGSEPKPGIDGDEKITILIHQMGTEAGGYFRSGDVYERLQSPTSNEREMVYLNSKYAGKPEAKSFLAHEFTHLVTINQKDLLRRITEEVWLNEARAEYAPTLLGYDDAYRGSNLERRVRDFLSNPSDSLVDWRNQREDYGVVNVFTQYLVDHYGVGILVDSLQSSQVGIASLNEALRKNNFQEDFSRVFTNWAIAVLLNDCTLGEKYCYLNSSLKDLRVTPTLYVIPRAETIFSTYHTTLNVSGNWHRLVGGGGNLTLEFNEAEGAPFTIPYVLCTVQEVCSLEFLVLDAERKGTLSFLDFDEAYSSLTLIPFAYDNTLGQTDAAESFSFSWKVTIKKNQTPEEDEEQVQLMSTLLARVAELQEQVRLLQNRLAVLQRQEGSPVGEYTSCTKFESNLSFGARSEEVRCLQEFLVFQGKDVYPEGLITGNFLSLTKQAIIRFQEKHASEILVPLGLQGGTGYVGQLTRNKINALLKLSTALAI